MLSSMSWCGEFYGALIDDDALQLQLAGDLVFDCTITFSCCLVRIVLKVVYKQVNPVSYGDLWVYQQ